MCGPPPRRRMSALAASSIDRSTSSVALVDRDDDVVLDDRLPLHLAAHLRLALEAQHLAKADVVLAGALVALRAAGDRTVLVAESAFTARRPVGRRPARRDPCRTPLAGPSLL